MIARKHYLRLPSLLLLMTLFAVPALAQETATETATESSAVGAWKWNRESISDKVRCELHLIEKDGKISGTYKDAEDVKAEVGEISVEGDEIKVELIFDNDGKKSEVVLSGKLDGDKITGTMVDGSTEQEWKAKRYISGDQVVGKWRMSFTTPDGAERNPEFELKFEDDKPVLEFEQGGDDEEGIENEELSKIVFKDGLLKFNLDMDFGGQAIKLEYELEFMSADELEGSMYYEFPGADMSGDVDLTGERIK